MELVQDYRLALVAMAILAIAVLIQAFMGAQHKLVYNKNNRPGQPMVNQDYNDKSFRVVRAFENSIEYLAVFILSAFLAMFAGAYAWLVNLLALTYLIARMAHWYIMVQGIGGEGGKHRPIAFVIGIFSNVGLAITALIALLFG